MPGLELGGKAGAPSALSSCCLLLEPEPEAHDRWGMRMHQGWARRFLHDRLQDLVINPEAKRHSRAYSRDHEASAFEEGAFNNPNRATSYAMRG